MDIDLFDPAPPFRLDGILDTRRTPKGMRPSRLPAWALDQIDGRTLRPAGVRDGRSVRIVHATVQGEDG
jgi:hypothetical protein